MSQAFGSGTGDTYSGSFWFRWVANRSTWGVNNLWHICLNTCGCSDHSVDCTWFDLDRRSAITLRHPGMCLAFNVMWYRSQYVMIFHRRVHISTERVPPCLFMQATTVELSIATSTVWFWQWSLKCQRASKTAFNSRTFICSLFSWSDNRPLVELWSKWPPQPSLEASVKGWILWSLGWRSAPLITFARICHQSRCAEMTSIQGRRLSSVWGYLQCSLRWNWKGFMWSHPRPSSGRCWACGEAWGLETGDCKTWEILHFPL